MSGQSKKCFLSVRFEGPHVSEGRIRLEDFVEVATEMMKAVERVAIVLSNAGKSTKRGPRPKDVKDAVSIDLVGFTHGSPAAVALFERTDTQMVMADVDLGNKAYTSWLQGFAAATLEGTDMPVGYDTGVLLKNRDIGKIFGKGISKVEFSLNHRPKPVCFDYTEAKVKAIRSRIAKPEHTECTVEGRLIMVDFKETGPKFRIDRALGGSVSCEFDESFRDEVYENILKHVRVSGTARNDAQGRIISIRLADIEQVDLADENENGSKRLALTGTEFWEHHTVEELADAQGVEVVSNVEALLGGWPDEVNDGFEDWVTRTRETQMIEGGK